MFKNRMTAWYLNKLPSKQDIYAIYSVIVFFVYTWAVFVSFYKLPAWLVYLKTSEILSVYAYIFLFCCLESLIILGGALLFEFTVFFFLRPQGFGARILLMFFVIFGIAATRLILYFDIDQVHLFLQMENEWWLAAIISIPVVMGVSSLPSVQTALKKLAENMGIFVYVYLPISIISGFVILIRNIS